MKADIEWIEDLKRENNYIKATDTIKNKIADLQINCLFEEVDEILLCPVLQELNVYHQIAFLSITTPFKKKYKNRERLFPLIEKEILKTRRQVAADHILDLWR